MRYLSNITAGSLKLSESRIVAGLLLRQCSNDEWHASLIDENAMQTRSPRTAETLAKLIRARLRTMDAGLSLIHI